MDHTIQRTLKSMWLIFFPLRLNHWHCSFFSWTYGQKWLITLVVSSFTFISPVASSMVAPASLQIAHDFKINSTVLVAMTTSVFVLGYCEHSLISLSMVLSHALHTLAVGPLVCSLWITIKLITNIDMWLKQILGPLSEIFGRSRVLQCSNIFFLGTVLLSAVFIMALNILIRCPIISVEYSMRLRTEQEPAHRFSTLGWLRGKRTSLCKSYIFGFLWDCHTLFRLAVASLPMFGTRNREGRLSLYILLRHFWGLFLARCAVVGSCCVQTLTSLCIH